MFKFEKKLIIGHQGCDEFEFNNTTKAFLKAIELGADMIQFDVRRTRDGVFIIHHDADVFGHRIRGKLYEDLKKIAERQGLALATLQETLETLEEKITLNIELKEKGYEKEVLNLILKYFTPAEFIVTSFHEESIRTIKKNFLNISAGLLLGKNDHDFDENATKQNLYLGGLNFLKRKIYETKPWERIEKCQADFIVPHWTLFKNDFMEIACAKSFSIIIRTVDDREMLSSMLHDQCIHGIITNKPGLAKMLQSQR